MLRCATRQAEMTESKEARCDAMKNKLEGKEQAQVRSSSGNAVVGPGLGVAEEVAGVGFGVAMGADEEATGTEVGEGVLDLVGGDGDVQVLALGLHLFQHVQVVQRTGLARAGPASLHTMTIPGQPTRQGPGTHDLCPCCRGQFLLTRAPSRLYSDCTVSCDAATPAKGDFPPKKKLGGFAVGCGLLTWIGGRREFREAPRCRTSGSQ